MARPTNIKAKGRVGATGKQLQTKLRLKIADVHEPGVTWVEFIPKALRVIQDTQGESGLSPYEILFVWGRPLQGLPYISEPFCHDATEWVERQQHLHQEVARVLQHQHQVRANAANWKRRNPPALEVGTKVWYRPEPQPGRDKLDPTWKGPGRILERVGASSYIVTVNGKTRQEAHRSQLYPHAEDDTGYTNFPMYYFSGEPQRWSLSPERMNT